MLADLITGLAAFSLISLAGLWLAALTWIRLVAEYANLGAAWQNELAWIGFLVAMPAMIATAYLAYSAYGLPRSVWVQVGAVTGSTAVASPAPLGAGSHRFRRHGP